METKNIKTISVSEIVNMNPGSIKVFEKYKIDFCCKGKLSFEEACQRAHVSEELVWDELNATTTSGFPASIRAQDWPLDFLVNYIIQNHHNFVKKMIPEILYLTDKVSLVHGWSYPELADIKGQFKILAEELEKHMFKEETILFPAVIDLVTMSNHSGKIEDVGLRLSCPIDVMEMEHENAGQYLSEIRELSTDFLLPPNACNSFRLLYQRLKEFEEDLHAHIHLENNILFPKALNLEADLVGTPGPLR